MEVRVEGYNLGTSIDDVASLSVKGVECPTRRRESSNTLVCVLGDPTVTSDLGEVRHSVVPSCATSCQSSGICEAPTG